MGFYENKIFPRLCSLATRHYDEQRRDVIASAGGRVLEIGVGVGSNFEYYTDSVTEVIGIEISSTMLNKSRARLMELQKMGTLPTSCAVIEASATALEFGDNEFDTVITFLVFCSIPKPKLAAKEIYRVLKPNGKMVFFEHVVASQGKLAKWQERLNPLWNRIACGCNLNRDTKSLFEKTGFRFEEIREYVHPKSMKLSSPKIQGIAVKVIHT